MSPSREGPTTAAQHATATDAILRDLTDSNERAVIVDSPPGAGKSTFVVRAAEVLSASGTIPIIAQTNAQANDLVEKILQSTDLMVGRLHGGTAPALEPNDRLLVDRHINNVAGADLIVSTAAKWAYVEDTNFPLAVLDEAYQMRSDQLFYLGGLFDRALLVGDPGQLDPFTPVDDSRWRGQSDGPVNPAVATVLHHNPNSPVHRLPVSWRLSARCAPLVSDAFYPQMPFLAGTRLAERELTGSTSHGSIEDEVIDRAIETGWGFLELDHRVVPATDDRAIDAVARIVIRLLTRNLKAVDEGSDAGPVGADRLAVGVVHRAQRSAARVRLDELATSSGIDASAVTVDTANRLQGREFHIVVVLHPLSGRAAASEFHLETGRLCVLLSRHRHACIVVGRAGISNLLDTHPLSSPIWLGAPIPIPDGWEANQTVLAGLEPVTIRDE